MSLYNFANNYIKDTPELLLASDSKSNVDISYSQLFSFYKQQERIYPIQSFMNNLFYDSILKNSQNKVQYETLNQKLKLLSTKAEVSFK